MPFGGTCFSFSWEVELILWIQRHMTSFGKAVFTFCTLFGEELLMIMILGFIYWNLDKKLGKDLGMAVITGLVWNCMIKNIFLRPRPYFDHGEIKPIRPANLKADAYNIVEQGYSFPSGHSTNTVTLFGTIAVHIRKRWMTILAILIPLATGISRFAFGVHYPTDVMSGWLLGGICILFISLMQSKIKNDLIKYAIILVTVIPGFFYCKSSDYFSSFGILIGFMFGTIVEEKYVNFEGIRKPLKMVLRVIGGLAVFLVLDILLKLPFSKEFLSSTTTSALLLRSGRYAIICFVEYGIYPMIFKRGIL